MKKIYAALFFLFAPVASAHEVYVLDSGDVQTAMSRVSPNPFSAIHDQQFLFAICGIVLFLLIVVVLRLSIFRRLEIALDPFLLNIKRFAPLVGRITLGLSLLASGYYNSVFGPELTLPMLAGDFAIYVRAVLLVLGLMVLFGFWTRFAAFIAALIYGLSVWKFGSYMLMYLNYLGEMILVFILGGGMLSLDGLIGGEKAFFKNLSGFLEKYGFLVLRVFFGVAIVSASYYAKYLHSNLALDTIADYQLTDYFHFTPLFLVLGAFIVEALIGTCLAIGFEIRFFALVFLGFLTMSILFFGESVWPHIILFGVNIALFLHGYDKYTVESVFLKKDGYEPVL